MKKLLLITATIFFIQTSNAQTTIDYFGQTPPGDKAVKFAPDIISLSNRDEINITFSPNGKECYFDAGDIYYTNYENDIWTEQEKEPVFDGFKFPTFSLDGKKMYLIKYSSDWKTSDIWVSERTAGGWAEPQILPEPFNSSSKDAGCTETLDGDIYFSSNRSGSLGIWCKQASSDKADRLGTIVNSPSAGDPCIAHDESYLIFLRNREGSSTFEDFYISFKSTNGEWTAPLNMEESGAGINLVNYSVGSPSLSHDGKYLFFNRHIPSTGASDIYWVSTSIIDTLKKIAMTTTVVDEANTGNLISVFPNPSKGIFTITLESNLAKNATAEIFTMDGKMALRQTIWNKSQTIDMANYSKGIYILKITTDSNIFTQKISLK
jgi:hypothetical protein